ncbi:acyltransferase family protein [Merismopedia glauca]|uniref:Acyltransferase 3 domain-containing protein n=1 Tax=Merismopedia glauca CCAP 1448/3 TaxID=1296344 RepID=A0A2T1C7Z6_9CYAN|nr:acyltransferase [Merismopedia glauca]PSB04366.1 hypothetical protein C7B64_04090 [Merismopedia glauca CCAP 1448/3]
MTSEKSEKSSELSQHITIEISQISEVEKEKVYFGSIDGLRAVGVLALLVYHAGFPGAELGVLGVDLFLTLSGFLITTLLVREYRKSQQINLLNFWGRRVLRVVPAYYLYIGLLTIFIGLKHLRITSPLGWSPDIFLPSLWLYFSNFVPRGGFWQYDWLTVHLWSLSLEVQFYLLWPFILSLIGIKKRTFWLPLSLLALMLAIRPILSDYAILCLPQGRGISIIIGCLLSLLFSKLPVKNTLSSWLIKSHTRISLAILCIILYFFLTGAEKIGLTNQVEVLRWFGPIFGLIFSIIIGSLWYGDNDLVSKTLSWSPLVYIGKISYGVYLYHMFAHLLTWDFLLSQIEHWPQFIKFGLRLLVYGVISIGLAAISYHFYEKSFLKLKKLILLIY